MDPALDRPKRRGADHVQVVLARNDGDQLVHTGVYVGDDLETYLAAAVDPRIAVAVPCIGAQSFRWALKNNDWQGRIGTIQPAFNAIAKNAGVAKPDSTFVKKLGLS